MAQSTRSPLADADAYAHVLDRSFIQELDQLKQLFTHGTEAVKAQDLEVAASTFDRLQHCIQHGVLSTCLAMRSYTYQKRGVNNVALKLSQALTLRNVRDPDGYLLAANQLLLQDNRSGAMRMLTTGIKRVPSDHPRHQSLVRLGQQLQQEIEQRNQTLLWLLPAEILDGILIHLFLEDLVILASTCKSWYKTVYEWPGTWRCFTVSHKDTAYKSSFRKLLAKAPKQHIRHLTLYQDMMETPTMLMYETIAGYRWNNIQSLSMSLLLDEEDMSAPLRIITNTKNTLQKLQLRNDMGKVLSHALKSCPNLRSLTLEDQIRYTEEELNTPPLVLPPGPFPLKDLRINCVYTTLNLLDLIRKSPHLESFHLTYDDETLEHFFDDLFRLIYYELPALRKLHVAHGSCKVFSSYLPSSDDDDYETSPHHHRHLNNQQPGLYDLVMTGNHLHAGSEKIDLLIRKSKTTLVNLDLDRHGYVTDIYNTIASTGMTALRKLGCGPAIDGTADYALLSSVIKACPMLQDVYLPPLSVSDDVLATLGQLQHLEKLALSMEGNQLTPRGMKRFMKSTPSLQYLEVSLSKVDTVKMRGLVQYVLACPSMRTLDITYDGWHEKNADMTPLSEEMQRSGLRKVIFSGRHQSLPMLMPWVTHLKELREIVIEEPPFFLVQH
ncbi:predicted protein [Lichtheimia corymbifera JMRC:FSU:9682]|uniref:F-box domain-containing protein n=1 Tax=Lichtheimia corymbifera JMRC:FSU:9682 TaxID=1263082 RepID=A0A068RXR8_9FUNG|nr:predicted protein [Lichtheimia corymbifera JMRC:FSU:9682]